VSLERVSALEEELAAANQEVRHKCSDEVRSSSFILYSAFNNVDCFKAALQR